MNGVLNNIFDEESLEAIRNASTIVPSVESRQTTKVDIEYEPVSGQSLESADLLPFKKEMMGKISAQAHIIDTLISSQNEMIGEINKLNEQIKGLKRGAVQVPSNDVNKSQFEVSEAPKKEQETQQTPAGDGLNPDEFSVEKMFYFGNN